MGNNTTSTPSIYKPKAFSKEHQLYAKYGSTPSRRQLRQFNKYWKSDQRHFDEILHDRQEFDRMFESGYRNLEYLRNKYKATPITTATSTPVISLESKYKDKIKINDYWTKVAKDNGFNSMYDVAEWQSKNGLYVDGKFGTNSQAKYRQLNGGTTPASTTTQPVLKGTRNTEYGSITTTPTSTPISTPEVAPETPTSETPKPAPAPVSTPAPGTKFNLNAFAGENKLFITTIDGKSYARYDPQGIGDYYIGEDGTIYWAGAFGHLGSSADKWKPDPGGAKAYHYNALRSKIDGYTPSAQYLAQQEKQKKYEQWYASYLKTHPKPARSGSLAGAQEMTTWNNNFNAAKKAAGFKQGGTMNKINYFKSGGSSADSANQKTQKPKSEATAPKHAGFTFDSRTRKLTPGYSIVSQNIYPRYEFTDEYGEKRTYYNEFSGNDIGRVIYNSPNDSDTVYYNKASDWLETENGYMTLGSSPDQEKAKKNFYRYINWVDKIGTNEEESREAYKRALSGHKQGGTMKYFQQGGAAPQQNIQQQIEALVQAAAQGDEQATKQITQIMEAAKSGNKQAIQLAQMIQQTIEKMKNQATAAKWGAKLGYIKSLKYAKGGKTCPDCEKKVEMKACGGKKAKKRYFGGLI